MAGITKMNIDVLTGFGPNAAFFANALVGSIQKYKSGNHTFNFLASQTANNAVHPSYNTLVKIEDVYVAENHAKALNLLTPYTTGDYVMIADPDIKFCYKDFDQILINLIENENCALIGGNCGRQYEKCNNFPSMAFQFWKGDIFRKLRPDFDYFKDNHDSGSVYYTPIDEYHANIYGIPINESVQTDVGWYLPKQVKILEEFGIVKKGAHVLDRVALKYPWSHSEGWIYDGEVFLKHIGFSRVYPEQLIQGWVNDI